MMIAQKLDSLQTRLKPIQCLSGNQLKLIAVVCMLIDHLSKYPLFSVMRYILEPMEKAGQEVWITCEQIHALGNNLLYPIGAIAFPLFCFLFVEGYLHTRSKKKYMLRLGLFALISELPFDVAFFGNWAQMDGTWPFYWSYQNVFFTYLLGLSTLFLMEQAGKIGKKVWSYALQGVLVFAMCCLAEFVVHADYEGYGVFLIVTFYVLRKNRLLQVLAPLALSCVVYNPHPVSLVISMLLILMYNGKRGAHNLKYFFYSFYPGHIIVVHLLDLLIRNL